MQLRPPDQAAGHQRCEWTSIAVLGFFIQVTQAGLLEPHSFCVRIGRSTANCVSCTGCSFVQVSLMFSWAGKRLGASCCRYINCIAASAGVQPGWVHVSVTSSRRRLLSTLTLFNQVLPLQCNWALPDSLRSPALCHDGQCARLLIRSSHPLRMCGFDDEELGTRNSLQVVLMPAVLASHRVAVTLKQPCLAGDVW